MITIRQATPADAEILAAAVETVAKERRYFNSVTGFSVQETRDYLQAITESAGVSLLAMKNNELVGWCDGRIVTGAGRGHAASLGIGVLPDYRGQGVGRTLMQAATNRLFAGGLDRVELEVYATNERAIGLYESLGFVHEGRKRNARSLDGVTEDILIMAVLRHEWENSNGDKRCKATP